MSQLQPTSADDYQRPAASAVGGCCHYCGAALSEFYYFCLACGTPYQALDNVLTPARPRQLTDEELVRIKTPQVATLFWTYLAAILGVGIFSSLLFREDRPDLQLLLNEIAILATTCYFGWTYRKSLAVQLKNVGFNQWPAYAGLALLLPLLAINLAYHWSIWQLIKDVAENPFERLSDVGISRGTLIVTFCLLPAVLEEVAYRGLMQHWLQTAIAPWKALVVASFLFAITHLAVASTPYLFLVGMLLGWTKQKTGSLYPSMAIHFLHNLAVIEFLLAT